MRAFCVSTVKQILEAASSGTSRRWLERGGHTRQAHRDLTLPRRRTQNLKSCFQNRHLEWCHHRQSHSHQNRIRDLIATGANDHTGFDRHGRALLQISNDSNIGGAGSSVTVRRTATLRFGASGSITRDIKLGERHTRYSRKRCDLVDSPLLRFIHIQHRHENRGRLAYRSLKQQGRHLTGESGHPPSRCEHTPWQAMR